MILRGNADMLCSRLVRPMRLLSTSGQKAHHPSGAFRTRCARFSRSIMWRSTSVMCGTDSGSIECGRDLCVGPSALGWA